MNALILSVQTVSFITSIGNAILSKTISRTADSICGLVRYISNYDQPYAQDVKRELIKIDLEFTVSVLRQFVEENKNKEFSDYEKQALLGVNDALEEINKELEDIKIAMKHHETKYFYKWRSLNCKSSICLIKKYKKVLDNRYNILMDFLKIKDNQKIDNQKVDNQKVDNQ